jgi:hypothetical protein
MSDKAGLWVTPGHPLWLKAALSEQELGVFLEFREGFRHPRFENQSGSRRKGYIQRP